jgi:coproporphyrinogen III oxidase
MRADDHQGETPSHRAEVVSYFRDLRETIISAFEALEIDARFLRKQWEHHSGGGGEISLLRGKVFEKAAVNWSGIQGEAFPMDDGKGPFFATGVSVITHMMNPHAPTVHFNVRYIETKAESWFGGGYDLTPMGAPYEEDTTHFHRISEESLGKELYQRYMEAAKEYFFLPHRNKERGVGGLFFDHLNSGSFESDYAFISRFTGSFLPAILPIYRRRIDQPFCAADKEVQNRLRGHYVEFNLLYDRGTRFGLLSQGNTDAILCSLPPQATW